MNKRTFALLFLSSLFTFACESEPQSVKPEPTSAAPKGHVEWLNAPEGEDVASVVRREIERARKDKREFVVYVGAKWCEPCERFHHAAEEGKIDDIFPRLRVLGFDLDRDAERLAIAGYTSQMIPLFVSPNDDGTASDKRIEGSVKGEAAIGDISGRLRRILPRTYAGP